MPKQIIGQQDIEALLYNLRAKTSGIQTYVSHKVLQGFGYSVTLSDGTILLYEGGLQSKEGHPDFRLPDIAARFCPAKP